jgi:hypothetical protein
MTPENYAKKRLRETIEKVAAELGGDPPYIENRGSTPFGLPGVDTHMLFHGRYFALEVKRFDGKGKIKGRQLELLARIRDAGGIAMVIDSEGQLALFEMVMRGEEKPPALDPLPQVNINATYGLAAAQVYKNAAQQSILGRIASQRSHATATQIQRQIQTAQQASLAAGRLMHEQLEATILGIDMGREVKPFACGGPVLPMTVSPPIYTPRDQLEHDLVAHARQVGLDDETIKQILDQKRADG